MKHRVALAFVSVVAAAVPGCSDDMSAFSSAGTGSAGSFDASSSFPDATTGSNRGDCDAYLSCLARARPDALASALAAYGPNGTCWNGDAGLADVCRTACQNALAEACSDGGADAGSTSDASVDGSSDAASDAPECTKGADCGDGRACVHGACRTCGGADGPCPCAQPGDCGGGLACVGGICSKSGDVCKYGSDCGGGVCIDGMCEAACGLGNSCPTGFTCVKGACEANVGTACTSNAQCTAPKPYCVGGNCVPSCSNDTQCGAGAYCDEGACAPDTRPKTNCQSDTQCTAGSQKCVLGMCKYPCTADDQCKVIDVRIGYCGVDQVCRSFTEAHPQCTSKADCAAAADCVDNVCK